jgi:pterin-4a-carbinolamine dehydratase
MQDLYSVQLTYHPESYASTGRVRLHHHTARVAKLSETDLIILDKVIDRFEGLIASKENPDLKFRVPTRDRVRN